MSFDSNSLQAFCQDLNVSPETLKEAERLCTIFIQNRSIQQPLYLYISASLLAVSRTKKIPLNFTQNLFKSLIGTEDFLEFFKGFLAIHEAPYGEVEEIVENYAFSWRLYKKFVEKWAQLELEEKQGHSGIGAQLKDMAWVLISLKRAKTGTKDLVENACILLASLNFTLTHLPATITFGAFDVFGFLVQLFNADPEQASEACSDFEVFLQDLKQKDLIRCGSENFEGVFAASHCHYNFKKLCDFYQSLLTDLIVSEIDFLKKNQPKTPVKHTHHRKNNVDLKSKRIISWDNESADANLKSKLGEVPVPASPCPHSFTPMSSAMELNNWLRDIQKKINLGQVPIVLQEYDSLSNFSIYAKIESYRNKLAPVMADKENQPSIGNESASHKSKSENVLKLYVYSLAGMIKNEQKRQGNLSTLYTNENFHQATFACSIECIVFAYGLSLNFEQVLVIAEVSVFEFWKLITTFMQFDGKMPISLKKHFRDLENYILNESAWTEQSPVRQMMSQFVVECRSSSGNPIFSIFFKRLLSYLAQKLVEITDQLEILEEVKEKIWELIKTCVTEHADLVMNRSLDTIVLCSIYAVCKLFKPISFKVLIENFSVINPGKEHVFKQISGSGDIVKFYNLCFIPRFKDYLSQGTENLKNFFQSPLRASLPITSPSRNSAFCSPKTPYLTPRTRKLWASAEGTHTIVHKKGRLISFDDEPQLPKIEEDSPIHHNKK